MHFLFYSENRILSFAVTQENSFMYAVGGRRHTVGTRVCFGLEEKEVASWKRLGSDYMTLNSFVALQFLSLKKV